MAIDCHSVRYQVLTVFASVMVLIYPIGCPLLLFFMLWRQKAKLFPSSLRESGTIVLEAQVAERRIILEDAPICGFAMIYKPRFYWWDLVRIINFIII